MKVKLTYFKYSGKYYSNGEYDSDKEFIYQIIDEVSQKVNLGRLPGLVEGANEFIVLVEVPDHEHNHPTLLNV